MSISGDGDKRILVIEDNPTSSYALSVLLKEFGSVETATSGRDALIKGTLNSFDVIVCDMNMPEIDGVEFYRAASVFDVNVKKRFLFLTSSFEVDHLNFFINNDIPFLFKPSSYKEIKKALEEIFICNSEQSDT